MEDEYEQFETETEILRKQKKEKYQQSIENMYIWAEFLTENPHCCDCSSKKPKYIVEEFGTIVCESCGKLLFQEFLLKVRYIYSNWKHDELLKLVRRGGNAQVNSVLENYLESAPVGPEEDVEEHFYYLVEKYCFFSYAFEKKQQSGFIIAVVEKEDNWGNNLRFTTLYFNSNNENDYFQSNKVLPSKRTRQDNYLWKNTYYISVNDFNKDTLKIELIDWTNDKVVEKQEIKICEIIYNKDVKFSFKNGENIIVTMYFYGENEDKCKKDKLSSERISVRKSNQLLFEKKRMDNKKKYELAYEKELQKKNAEKARLSKIRRQKRLRVRGRGRRRGRGGNRKKLKIPTSIPVAFQKQPRRVQRKNDSKGDDDKSIDSNSLYEKRKKEIEVERKRKLEEEKRIETKRRIEEERKGKLKEEEKRKWEREKEESKNKQRNLLERMRRIKEQKQRKMQEKQKKTQQVDETESTIKKLEEQKQMDLERIKHLKERKKREEERKNRLMEKQKERERMKKKQLEEMKRRDMERNRILRERNKREEQRKREEKRGRHMEREKERNQQIEEKRKDTGRVKRLEERRRKEEERKRDLLRRTKNPRGEESFNRREQKYLNQEDRTKKNNKKVKRDEGFVKIGEMERIEEENKRKMEEERKNMERKRKRREEERKKRAEERKKLEEMRSKRDEERRRRDEERKKEREREDERKKRREERKRMEKENRGGNVETVNDKNSDRIRQLEEESRKEEEILRKLKEAKRIEEKRRKRLLEEKIHKKKVPPSSKNIGNYGRKVFPKTTFQKNPNLQKEPKKIVKRTVSIKKSSDTPQKPANSPMNDVRAKFLASFSNAMGNVDFEKKF